MNEIANSFVCLREIDESKLFGLINQHEERIIESFGGWTNMIELCLTNPSVSSYISTNSKHYNSLKDIFSSTSINTNIQQLKETSVPSISMSAISESTRPQVNTHVQQSQLQNMHT